MPKYLAVFRADDEIRTLKLDLPGEFSPEDPEWGSVGGRSALKVGKSLFWIENLIALLHEDDLPRAYDLPRKQARAG